MSFPLEPRPQNPALARPEQPFEALHQAPLAGPVELYAERTEPVVYVPDAYGRMVPVLRSQADALLATVPATRPRDLAPQPLFDPRAQVVLAKGVATGAAAAGIGYAAGQILAPLAAFTSGGLVWVLLLLLIAGGGARRGGGDTYTTHVHTRWWGRAHVRNGR
ncbi:hypothetical protein [Streptomyces venezuelae]|uniref:hypothetical protein n=1 Tax=Streptomyces venezuelae TaxID=54571 RepID=UPI00343913E6